MAASGVNVLRYSALGAGIFYGVYHQSALSSQAKIHETNREYAAKQNLIAKAKAEWTKKNLPADKKTSGGGVITDPMDPKFDLEAYLNLKMADEAK
ncbi:MAG: hypothetical protein MMC33_001575 [Icmadophila ericetorum]|nr:hypothetical protein [Icmadophila ericetorum]